MRTTAQETAILTDVLDRDGHETGRAVFVEIHYLVDVDDRYGEDADGNRGARRVEYQILSIDVDPAVRRTLLCEEYAQVLCDAAIAFHARPRHH